MLEKSESQGNSLIADKDEIAQVCSNLNGDKHATEEEFQNFLQRVLQVEKIVKQIVSKDESEQKRGMLLADQMLGKNDKVDLPEIEELKIKTNRSVINKYSSEDSDPNRMTQEAFKRGVEKDAKERAESRRARNERAETYKRVGNGAFKEGNYEKAIAYFSKALEQRKDSSVIWNNRALSYMKLQLYEKALNDCEWALKVNDSNIKALLNSAKCYKLLNNEEKSEEFIALARQRNPLYHNYISEFQKNLKDLSSPDKAEANCSLD